MEQPIGNENRKKIGFIGLGSIGLRHLNSLLTLGINDFIHLKTGKGKKHIPEIPNAEIVTIENVLGFEDVDGIIISNPTSLHGETIKNVLHLGKPLFVEKPLSNSYIETIELFNLLRSYPSRIQVGFTLRYNPLIRKVKEIINSGVLGEIYFSKLSVGQYLPFWHPYTDYSTEYFSQRSLGGGAVRTLCHEIDLAIHFFGKPIGVNGFIDKVSPLNIDVDDYADIYLKYDRLKIKINIDFLSREPFRTGVIMGTEADLYYDIFNKDLHLIDNKSVKTKIEVDDEDMYVEQMKGFIENMDESFSNLEDSLAIIQIINQLEEINNN